MAQAFVHNSQGTTTVDFVAGSAISAGDVVVLGSLVGIAPKAIASGATGVMVCGGVGKFTLKASLAITAGDAVYWDDTNNEANKTSSGNTLIGYATLAQSANDPYVYVRAIN